MQTNSDWDTYTEKPIRAFESRDNLITWFRDNISNEPLWENMDDLVLGDDNSPRALSYEIKEMELE